MSSVDFFSDMTEISNYIFSVINLGKDAKILWKRHA